MTAELAGLRSGPAQVAASRSRMYGLLAATFAFPDEELHTAVRDGSLAATIAVVADALPYRLGGGASPGLSTATEGYVDFESEYIRLFDVGAAGPPCPLYGGVYLGDRMKVMEEATRFYNYFHLKLSPEIRELPDHITTELEFLHYLTFREAEAHEMGTDASSLLRAERDFLARHVCRWMPKLRDRLAKQNAAPFFTALVDLAVAFFDADHAYAASNSS